MLKGSNIQSSCEKAGVAGMSNSTLPYVKSRIQSKESPQKERFYLRQLTQTCGPTHSSRDIWHIYGEFTRNFRQKRCKICHKTVFYKSLGPPDPSTFGSNPIVPNKNFFFLFWGLSDTIPIRDGHAPYFSHAHVIHMTCVCCCM